MRSRAVGRVALAGVAEPGAALPLEGLRTGVLVAEMGNALGARAAAIPDDEPPRARLRGVA